MGSKSKRNPERRESTIKEFRDGIFNKEPVQTGTLTYQINQLSQIQKSATDGLDNKLAAAIKIKQLEDLGVLSKEDIEKERKRLGLSDGNSSLKKQDGTSAKDLLMLELQNETDPDRRNDLLHTITAVEQLEKSGNTTLAMSLATRPRVESKKKTSTFEEKFMERAVSILLEEKKDPVDSLDKVLDVQKKITEMQPAGKTTDEFISDIEKAKKLGLVRDNAQTENEMKLQIEKLRIDNQYKIEEQKIDADKDRTTSLTNVVGDVIGSVAAAGAAALSKEPGKGSVAGRSAVRNDIMQSSYEAVCAKENCGAKILVSNVDQSRDIECGSCGQIYHLDSKDKQLYMIQETPSNPTTPSNA